MFKHELGYLVHEQYGLAVQLREIEVLLRRRQLQVLEPKRTQSITQLIYLDNGYPRFLRLAHHPKLLKHFLD